MFSSRLPFEFPFGEDVSCLVVEGFASLLSQFVGKATHQDVRGRLDRALGGVFRSTERICSSSNVVMR